MGGVEGQEIGVTETNPVPDRPPQSDEVWDYDAFLSYTHRDRAVVSGIQKGLHRIGRRWGQLRALRIFRDDTDLTVSPDLWAKITDAMDRSRFLIVVLSPEAAQSVWVNKEFAYWLTHRGHETLMLVLADGVLMWDGERACFDPQTSDAAVPGLTEPGRLPSEPFFVDVSGDAPWDIRGAPFREKITALAAPIHGKPKDQLASDDLREQRRFRRLRAAAVAALAVLTVAAIVAALIAVGQRQQALAQRNTAIALRLNSEADAMLAGSRSGGDIRAFQQLLAARTLATPDEGALLHATAQRASTVKVVAADATFDCVTFSPDGRRLATGGADNTVRIWDAETARPLVDLVGHTGPVTNVAFSPDGRRLATASADTTVRLWNVDTGRLLATLRGHTGSVTAVAFTADGRLATASGSAVRFWEARTGRSLGPAIRIGFLSFESAAFSSDGRILATANALAVDLWDAATGRHVGTTKTNLSVVSSVAIGPDNRVAAAFWDGSVRIWSFDNPTPFATLTGHAGKVNALAFSADGQRLASAGFDNTVRLWNTATGRLLATLPGHTDSVTSVAFSPDGRHLASVSVDGTMRLWTADLPLAGHDDEVTTAVFSPDGRHLASSGPGKTVVWEIDGTQPVGAPVTIYQHWTSGIAYSPDGRRFAGADLVAVRLWNVAGGRPVGDPLVIAPGADAVAFSPDGHRLATGGADGAMLWNADTGQRLAQLTSSQHAVRDVAFSPDGHRVATAGFEKEVRLWNADTAQQVAVLSGHTASVRSVAFSDDGQLVATAGDDNTVRLWNAEDGHALATLTGHKSWVTSVAFGPDSHHLASTGYDSTVRLWDADTGKPLADPFTGDTGVVNSVAFSPDGHFVATASNDSTVRFWPADATPKMLCDKLVTNMTHQQWRDWVSPDVPYTILCPELPVPSN